jgi:hypothetical protein
VRAADPRPAWPPRGQTESLVSRARSSVLICSTRPATGCVSVLDRDRSDTLCDSRIAARRRSLRVERQDSQRFGGGVTLRGALIWAETQIREQSPND